MATRAGFQNLADKLINNTFADFRDDVILSVVGEFDYATQTETTTDTVNTKGIRLAYSKNQVDGQSVQSGDYKVIVLQKGLSIDVRADNVKMLFNSKNVNIVSVDEDAARAVYALQVRDA